MKKLFILLLLLVFAPSYGARFPVDTLRVLQVAQEEGLSQLGATSLQFDKQGYLWVGTQNGLNRFNGNQMKVWLADKGKKGLQDDHIRGMYYQNDTLWMTTNTYSLCAYLVAEDRFIHFEDRLNFERNRFVKYSYALHPMQDNGLLVGTAGHCLLVDKHRKRFDVLPVPHMMENDFVTAIQWLQQTLYLVGTNASGVYLLDTATKEFKEVPRLKILKQTQVNALYKNRDNSVWMGTDKGLYRVDKDLEKVTQHASGTIRSIQRWDESRLLVGGKNENFFLTEEGKRHNIVFTNHAGKEISSDLLAYQEDEQGGKWMGTETRGIFYYHPLQTKFTTLRIQASNSPKKDFISTFNFLRDADDLWMATEFGFVKHRLHTNDYKLYRTDLLEYTLAKDAQGTIWAGGFEQGLLRYNREKDVFDAIPLSFEDKDIIQITPITADSIWVHTWSSGIYSMDTQTLETHLVTLFGKNIVRARSSLIDKKGVVWIGSDEGLYQVIPNDKVVHYNALSNERVFALAEDKEGVIWVGTAKGLNAVDPINSGVVAYTTQIGLPNDFIYGVEVDDNNNVWVSTNYGISVLDRETNAFKNYTEDDGLQNNEFNGKAGYKDALGYLYFGGMNGFNVFHPDSIPVNRHTGRAHIENVLLFGKPIKENILYTDTLVFSHNQNVITFDFINLNYLWSKKNKYQFKLEGFDKEWRPVTKDRSTTYTNLEPGSYQFKVRGSNNEFLWGDVDSITVIIRSPWYETLVFRGGMLLLFILLLVGGFLYKTHQQQKNNLRLKQMVAARTEELSKSNDALHESLTLSQRQRENITFLMQELNHRVKNNLQLITSLIDMESFQIDDHDTQEKLRVLQSRVFTVARIHDLLNVDDSEKGEKVRGFIESLALDLIAFSGQQINLVYHLVDIKLSSNKLTYLGLVLNELITNSMKHAFQEEQIYKEIEIQLYIDEELLVLRYQDNGVGFTATALEQSKRKGMGLIYLLVKELRGTVEVKSSEGALFIIRLPLKG